MPMVNLKPCCAFGCEERIERQFLMCTKHWKSVPQDLQRKVYATLHCWLKGGPSRPYVVATIRARLAVATHEHRGEHIIAAFEAALQLYAKGGE
jgi:hypothetical protein